MAEAGEVRIVVGEDSQAGRELWLQLEQVLADSLSPRTLSVTVSQNASELLGALRSLERAARRPDLVLIDLHVPIRSKTVAMAPTGVDGWPETAKAGVWIAKRIRARGNGTTRLVLWTSNVLPNELNDAYAFCNLTVDGRPIGDYVIDKTADASIQAQLLARLLEADGSPAPDLGTAAADCQGNARTVQVASLPRSGISVAGDSRCARPEQEDSGRPQGNPTGLPLPGDQRRRPGAERCDRERGTQGTHPMDSLALHG